MNFLFVKLYLLLFLSSVLEQFPDLELMEDQDILQEDDMYEMYDYFVRGSLEKDEEYHINMIVEVM